MNSLLLLERQKKAQEAFARLPTPRFRYGQGIGFALKEIDALIDGITTEGRQTIVSEMKPLKLSGCDQVFIRQCAEMLAEHDENKVLAAHLRACPDADVFIIPKGITNPIIVRSSGKANSTITVVEEGAEAVMMLEHNDTSHVHQLYLQRGAKLTLCTIAKKLKPHFEIRRAALRKDSFLKMIDVITPKGFAQIHVKTELKESGAQVEHWQAFTATGQIDLASTVVHEKPHTHSKITIKGVVADLAKAVHRATITIANTAEGCTGRQRTDVLMRGENARCDAIPILEVGNNDVVCSHGSTMGQIDEEQLFYLMSRGISPERAEEMMVHGFLQPVLELIPAVNL